MTDHQKTQAEIELERRNRALTDEDIQALATEFENRIVARFDSGIGRGIRSIVWRLIVWSMIALAAYGASKGLKP